MDSSPDLSVKLRRGSSDSRDSFYMGFAQGIDSDIEEVTTVQNPPPPPTYPVPEEPPIDIPAAVEPPEALVELPETEISEDEEQKFDEQDLNFEEQKVEEVITEPDIEAPQAPSPLPLEPSQLLLDQIPPPPLYPDEDEDETNTSVTVIQSKNKTPSSSSSSISSAINELTVDDTTIKCQPEHIGSPKAQTHQPEVETVIASPVSSHHKSPPRNLNLNMDARARNFDSESTSDSMNAMDCKIDDDNRDDSSPTDSMPPAPTPPPLGFPLSLEKR